jgi:hypothetical protein
VFELCAPSCLRSIFVWLCRCFPAILNAITVVKPETVIRWHRRGFWAYWRWKSRRDGGRPRIDREIRDLIERLRLMEATGELAHGAQNLASCCRRLPRFFQR